MGAKWLQTYLVDMGILYIKKTYIGFHIMILKLTFKDL